MHNLFALVPAGEGAFAAGGGRVVVCCQYIRAQLGLTGEDTLRGCDV